MHPETEGTLARETAQQIPPLALALGSLLAPVKAPPLALVPRTRVERARCTSPQVQVSRTRLERARCTPQVQVPRTQLERARCTPQALEPRTRLERARCTPQALEPRTRLERVHGRSGRDVLHNWRWWGASVSLDSTTQ